MSVYNSLICKGKFSCSKVPSWLPASMLLASLWSLLGAAEFPEFSIPELDFDAAISDEEFFEGKIEEFSGVPRVSERSYEPEDLRRLPIESVIIEGVAAYPERDITKESVQRVIDRAYSEQKNLNLDDNGFTPRDLDVIGQKMRELLDSGRVPNQQDMDELYALARTTVYQREWITIEQLDAIALAVTEYYRENGFILATAFIPEQEVADGVVRLSVLEGRLGDVTVSNNLIFDDDTIMAAFNKELGEAVTEDQMESALRRINDLPGVRVRGSFSPGENVGETRLNLATLEEKSWTSSILMDNHGSETTGETRIFATTEWFDLWDKGHRFVLGILRSEGPDSTTFGIGEYEWPVTSDGRGKLKASISTNEFSVTRLATLPEIVGETDNYSLTGTYDFIRGRTQNLRASAVYTQKDVLFQVGELATLSTDQVIDSFAVFADYNQLWDDRLLLFSGRLGIDQGHVVSGEVNDQSTNFTKVLFNANLLKRFSINNWLTKEVSNFNFVTKVNAQYAEQFMSSVEQFSLGGPNGVRAFGVSDVSVDSGIYMGFELYFDTGFIPVENLGMDPLKPYLFYDYAYGVSRGIAGNSDRDARIKGYGLGVRLNWPDKLEANLIFSTPSSAWYEDNFLESEGESRVFVDVTYKIH